MNVVFVVPRFYPYRGGYENYILKLATYLRKCGHKITVLTSNAIDLEAFWLKGFRTVPAVDEDRNGVLIRRFPIDHRKWIRRSGRLLSLLGHWRLEAKYRAPGFRIIGLPEAIGSTRPDVVHVGPLPYTRLMYEGLRESSRCAARVIATPCTHFGEDGSDVVARHYTRRAQIRLLNHCHAVLALTDTERERLIRLGLDPSNVHTTRIGIDVPDVTGGDAARFRSRWNISGQVILQLGTKAKDKGTVSVIDAMKTVWQRYGDAWLVLAGASTTEFDGYLTRQGTLPRLLNLGPISDAEKRDLLAAATLLVHPSRVESFGVVYLEAWANGKPVIGADTAVTREVIQHGKDGLVVRFGDMEAIARAIEVLLQDVSMRESMGQFGRAKVLTHFSWGRLLPILSELFVRPRPTETYSEAPP